MQRTLVKNHPPVKSMMADQVPKSALMLDSLSCIHTLICRLSEHDICLLERSFKVVGLCVLKGWVHLPQLSIVPSRGRT